MTEAQLELVLAALSGVLFASLIAYVAARRSNRRAYESGLARQAESAAAEQRLLDERIDVRQREISKLEQRLESIDQDRERLRVEHGELHHECAALSADKTHLLERLAQVGDELAELRRTAALSTAAETEAKARLEETNRAFAEKEALFKDTSESLKKEFQLLANKIFEAQRESFAANNKRQLAGVIDPFKEQINEFKQRVEQVYHTESKDRASLLTEVRNLQQASERVNKEAENLANALKGDKRIQGGWGELVLERVLDDSGLRRGHEYSVQSVFQSEAGEARRPDVIIHLPGDKDVVVDAKVSLVAYEQAMTAEDDSTRLRLTRQHVADLRAQVRRLADQDYDRLKGIRSLDFVLLFIPVEPAFTLAMEHDAKLFTEAFNKRIVIVSPTTLMMTLRIIHNVWRYEHQNTNAQEIARRAGALYDKLRRVIEDMSKLGSSLQAADTSYQAAMRRMVSGRGNLVRQVEQFRELGASVKKPMPREVLEESAAQPGSLDEQEEPELLESNSEAEEETET